MLSVFAPHLVTFQFGYSKEFPTAVTVAVNLVSDLLVNITSKRRRVFASEMVVQGRFAIIYCGASFGARSIWFVKFSILQLDI